MNVFGQNLYPDANGNPELNPFDYTEFYDANIAPHVDENYDDNKDCFYEGKPSQAFIRQFKQDYFDNIKNVLEDKKLEQLQSELEKEGKQVCMFNMYVLSMFIIEQSKNHYVFLLKPSPREILEGLKDVSKITFADNDKNNVETNSKTLITKVLKVLETETDNNTYEIDSIVTWDKISNKSLICCYFVHNLTIFMNKYFQTKRKKNALISTKEVELILYLMKFTGLSNAILTNKRYWQLMNAYEKISRNLFTKDYATFCIEGKTYKMPLRLIPYSMWHNGRLDWTENDLPRVNGGIGTILQF